jgi:hypothetical protein
MKIIGFRLGMATAAVLSLSACAQSGLRLSPDFGDAEREDVAAQIADPDAHYRGLPAPGSNGARVGLAQDRYQKNQVIQPSSTTASSASSIGNAENGGGGAPGTGSSAGASTGAAQAGP